MGHSSSHTDTKSRDFLYIFAQYTHISLHYRHDSCDVYEIMNATDVYIYPRFTLNQRPESSLGFEKLVEVLSGKMFLKFSK